MEQLRDREKVAGLLRQVLEAYGEELLDDNQKLNALLMDYMPRYNKERKFIVKALELGIGKELIDARRGITEEKHNVLNRCKATLESELLLSEDSAKYLVTVIAKALHRETAIPEKKIIEKAAKTENTMPGLKSSDAEKKGEQKSTTEENSHPRSDIPESKESQPQKLDSSSVPPKPNPQTTQPQPQKLETTPVLPKPIPQTEPSLEKQRKFSWKLGAVLSVIIIAIIAGLLYRINRYYHPSTEDITEISFCDSVDAGGWRTWKVPEIGPDAVAWAEEYHLYIGQDGVVTAGERAPQFGKLYPNVRTIQFDGNYDTSNVEDMSWMFYSCNNLSELDLSAFDTSNVTDMSFMFDDCDSLSELDISSFDTSNVKDMRSMFSSCDNLSELNLSSFDTSNVMDMRVMFYSCDSLSELDLSSFDTSNVTDMRMMFFSCDSLSELDLSSFDTSNVTDMSEMFDYCNNLTNLITNDECLKEQYAEDI